MTFVQFIENQYQELTAYQQVHGFKLGKDAEVNACQTLLQAYRRLAKWFMMPKVIGTYWLVNLKLLKAPEPVLLNKMKADKEAKEQATNVTAINTTPG